MGGQKLGDTGGGVIRVLGELRGCVRGGSMGLLLYYFMVIPLLLKKKTKTQISSFSKNFTAGTALNTIKSIKQSGISLANSFI